MQPPGAYHFGRTLATRVDFFAFPRTGSHYFRHCTAGLFDLVELEHADTTNPEAASRASELDPDILYALTLREDGVPYRPVWFNARAAGQHGFPVKGPAPVVILTRQPAATVYSFYRVARDRAGFGVEVGPDPAAWISARLERYHLFLSAAASVLREHPQSTLVIRYEDLRAGPEPLVRLVELVGVRPKMRPELVHKLTRFDVIARPGARTFYRAGDNDAWRQDPEFLAAWRAASVPDFSSFPFVSPHETMSH